MLRFALVVACSRAAIPPLQPEQRLRAAAHVVVGRVTQIETSLRDERGDLADQTSAEWIDRVSAATIAVEAVDAGSIVNGTHSTFSFWRTERRPRGMVGNQGQSASMEIGQRVRVFARADMELLAPNGFEILDEAPPDDEAPPPPRLVHSRRHGLAGEVVARREVTTEECPWLEAPLAAGARLQIYTGHTYGAISRTGVAVTRAGEDGPWFEVPTSAPIEPE